MAKKGKGGKTRRRGKNKGDEGFKRELLLKEDGQEYAAVTKMLGNGRVEAHCYDGKVRMCTIRGTMRRKVWINQGDIVLCGLRDFQDDRADIIHRYNVDEARLLKKMGELPVDAKINEGGPMDGPEGDEFGEEEEFDIEFDEL